MSPVHGCGEILRRILANDFLFGGFGNTHFEIDVTTAHGIVAQARGDSIEERLERPVVDVRQRRSAEFGAHEIEVVAQLFAR